MAAACVGGRGDARKFGQPPDASCRLPNAYREVSHTYKKKGSRLARICLRVDFGNYTCKIANRATDPCKRRRSEASAAPFQHIAGKLELLNQVGGLDSSAKILGPDTEVRGHAAVMTP